MAASKTLHKRAEEAAPNRTGGKPMHILIAGGDRWTDSSAGMSESRAYGFGPEQAPEIADVGAGIQISPNGMKVLDALGHPPVLPGMLSGRGPRSCGWGGAGADIQCAAA